MKPSTSSVVYILFYRNTKCFFAILTSIYTFTVSERNIRDKNATFPFFKNTIHAKHLLVPRFFTDKSVKLLKRADKNVTLNIMSECVDGLILSARLGLFHLSCRLSGTFFMSNSNILCGIMIVLYSY